MQKETWHFITVTLVSVLLCALASCSHEAESVDVPSADDMTLSIGFKVPTRAAADGYEEGETYENYIDIASGNYRIYFFGADNKLISRFEPFTINGFVATEGSNYTEYSVFGKVPEELVEYKTFKMVVLANWPQYNDAAMVVGETTIDDLCKAGWAQYDCLAGHVLGPTAGKYMPFYGVHEYSGVDFTKSQTTTLTESVTLLRAMAKVEVILETDDYFNLSFTSVAVNRYNAKGFCAPKNVLKQSDYDHNGNYAADYVHTLNLVGDKNDAADKNLTFRKVRRWDENGKRYEKWVAYLPEYQNQGAGNAYSSIKAKFDLQVSDDTPHTIYFADYSDGKTDNSDSNRLNIERNNIYRFKVKCTGYNFKLLLTVSDWEGLYENVFNYGDGQIVSPTAPWEDEISNDIEL